MIKTLWVFPADPLISYVKKGEVKKRYWNANNYFDKIIVFAHENDYELKADQVQTMAGSAKLHIVPLQGYNYKVLPHYFSRIKKTFIESYKLHPPNVIRGHGPYFAGALAVYCGRIFDVPTVVSLHGNGDYDFRYIYKQKKDWKKYLIHKIFQYTLEPYCLKNASHVISAYEFPYEYALKYGAKRESTTVIYNKVYLEQFNGIWEEVKSRPVENKKQYKMLCIGRLIDEKNQQVLIEAVKDLPIHLILVGDGPDYEKLVNKAKGLNMEDRLKIIRSMPHTNISEAYKEVDLFAMPLKYGGVSIPVLEAMACGIPTIVPEFTLQTEMRLLHDAVLVARDNTAQAYKNALEDALLNWDKTVQMGKNGRIRLEEYCGEKMELIERNLYHGLVNSKILN